MGDLHTVCVCVYVCAINAEAYSGILERHGAIKETSQEVVDISGEQHQASVLQVLQQCSFVDIIDIECMCLTGEPAVQIHLLLKIYGTSWRRESDNRDYGLCSHETLNVL